MRELLTLSREKCRPSAPAWLEVSKAISRIVETLRLPVGPDWRQPAACPAMP